MIDLLADVLWLVVQSLPFCLVAFFGSGCPCCRSKCKIGGDTFSRDDSAELGPKWIYVSGTWSILSHKLRAVGADLVQFATPHPDGVDGNQRVTVTITPDSAADNTSRVLVAYADDDNYLFAEVRFTAGCPVMQLGQRLAGVDDYLGESVPLFSPTGTAFIAKVCWEPNSGGEGQLKVLADGSGGFSTGRSYLVESVAAEGAYVGLEVVTGTTNFASFRFGYYATEETTGGYSGYNVTRPDCEPSGCLIYSESFVDRDADTDIGCHWSEEAGDWELGPFGGSGGLGTTDSDGLALCLHPGTAGRQYIAGIVHLDNDADRARIVFDAVDALNYHYCQLRVNTAGTQATLVVGKVTAGVGSTIQTTNVTTAAPRVGVMHVCLSRGYLIFAYTDLFSGGTHANIRRLLTGLHNGLYAGLGSGSVTTAIGFENFNYTDRDIGDPAAECFECPPPPCDAGCGDTTPNLWLVEVLDVRQQLPGDPEYDPFNPVCNCDVCNQAFLQAWDSSCNWLFAGDSSTNPLTRRDCGGNTLGSGHYLPYSVSLLSGRVLEVSYGRQFPVQQIRYRATIPEGMRCDEVENLEMTLHPDDSYLDLTQFCFHDNQRILISAAG
jgi:hypothetical protein